MNKLGRKFLEDPFPKNFWEIEKFPVITVFPKNRFYWTPINENPVRTTPLHTQLLTLVSYVNLIVFLYRFQNF